MKMITFDISPDILDWLFIKIKVINVSQKTQENITKWKNGEKKPTFNQIEKLSKETNIPLGYFFLKVPPKEEIDLLEYRTIDSLKVQNPSRNLIDIINKMEDLQEWMRDYLTLSEDSKLNFVGSMRNSDIISIVNSIRKTINLDIEWFNNSKNVDDSFKKLRYYFEDIGIIIMMSGIVGQNTHRKLDIEEFRAFTIIDDYAPLIFINSNDSPNGKLFSLLHEVAHIWIGENDFFNNQYNNIDTNNSKETLCNAIATEILVPQKIFKNIWNKLNDISYIDKINKLSSYFKCSKIVIARKALDNNYISHFNYNNIFKIIIEKYKEQQKNSSQGGNYYATMSTRFDHKFLKALSCSVEEGKTLYTEAYRLTNTNRKTFDKLIENVRGKNL